MSLFFSKYSKNVSVAGGISSTTTPNIDGILMHLIVRANSDETTFDFQLYDDDDVVVLERNDINGSLNELMSLPLGGKYTLSITDSSANETFRIYMMTREI